ncbi:MAG: hypothetical protein HLX46_02650 [Corynebacterium sp.]|uniref:hypothetical protein n=1 Tax=Corynebacterium sp. TaxID=1720 RepID=UPI0017AA8927|nr:hypothetical protein [Corynebacterium sp.]NWO15750.1 hypothetical protein [Corynebacterium sp.]
MMPTFDYKTWSKTMANSYDPTNPGEPEAHEERLVFLIATLDSLIDDNDTRVSGHAIRSLSEAREELAAEHRLLQRGII